MRQMKEKKKEAAHFPQLPKRPERTEDFPRLGPTPLPNLLPVDSGRLLKQILNRLDAIEKRLNNIERLLESSQRTS